MCEIRHDFPCEYLNCGWRIQLCPIDRAGQPPPQRRG